MKRRVIGAVAASSMAWAMAVATGGIMEAICAIYTPDNPEWCLFFCYLVK